MKLWCLVLLIVPFTTFAQKPCEYATDVKDSIGTYKATKDYLMHQKIFGDYSSNIYFSMVQNDGMPLLNIQMIQKSKDFIKVNCLNKNSRVYLQLNNGKIVTLIPAEDENCGTSVRNGDGYSHRILSGFFMFMKDSYEELKKSPVSIMRIKYGTETEDYIIKPHLVSETDQQKYWPENYFIKNLRCVEN